MLNLINNNLAKIIFLITLLSTPVSLASEWWDYQFRGDRWEGIAPKPVSGWDIELLSALIDYHENWYSTFSDCKLKFYLPHAIQVDLIVQELRPKEFYKMDRVIPKRPWRQHDFNYYQWTSQVIKGLKLKIPQLGVLVRLTKPDKREYVAPVVFYHSTLPSTHRVTAYRFVFKVAENAKLNYAVFPDNSDITVAEGNLSKQYASEPFLVYWDSSMAPEGRYELIVDGYFLNNYAPIYKSVQFYHKPLINRTR